MQLSEKCNKFTYIYRTARENKLLALKGSCVETRSSLLADSSQKLLDLSNGFTRIQTLKKIIKD